MQTSPIAEPDKPWVNFYDTTGREDDIKNG